MWALGAAIAASAAARAAAQLRHTKLLRVSPGAACGRPPHSTRTAQPRLSYSLPLPPAPQAYEFTLDRLGQDSACGSIWLDYIAFLTAPRQGSPEYAAIYGEAMEGQVRRGARCTW